MSEGSKVGLQAVIDAQGIDLRPSRAEQLALDGIGEDEAGGEDGGEPGRRGRPPGASNKRTSDVARFLGARYRSPLVGASEIAAMDVLTAVQVLKPVLGGSGLEVANFWLKCVTAVLPYREQQLPRAVELQGEGAAVEMVFVFGDGRRLALDAPEMGVILDVQGDDEESEENQ